MDLYWTAKIGRKKTYILRQKGEKSVMKICWEKGRRLWLLFIQIYKGTPELCHFERYLKCLMTLFWIQMGINLVKYIPFGRIYVCKRVAYHHHHIAVLTLVDIVCIWLHDILFLWNYVISNIFIFCICLSSYISVVERLTCTKCLTRLIKCNCYEHKFYHL